MPGASSERSSPDEPQSETSSRPLTLWATLLALFIPTQKPAPDFSADWRARLDKINNELAFRHGSDSDSDSDMDPVANGTS